MCYSIEQPFTNQRFTSSFGTSLAYDDCNFYQYRVDIWLSYLRSFVFLIISILFRFLFLYMNTLSKVDIRLIKLSIIKLTQELHKKKKMFLTKQSPPFSVVSTLLINVFDTMHDVNVKCKQLHSLPFKSHFLSHQWLR